MFPTRTMVFATLFLTVAAAVAAWLSTPRPAGIGAVSPESPTVASRGVESSAPAVEPETPARILDTVEPEAARLPATENAEARRLDAPDLPESREQVVTVPQAETAPEAPPVADEASASEAVAHAEPDAVVEEAAPPEKAVEIETGALRDGRESQARKPPGPARVKPAKKVAKPARPKPVQSARATPPRAAAPKPVQSPKATANGRDATTEILSGGL